jgi:hypothetical protein
MGKKFITIALILIGLNSFSQENKKWIPSVRAGVGTWLDITYLVHGTIGAQIEYKSTEVFSLIGNVDFARNFATSSKATEFNQLSIAAGPRFYIQETIFVGAAFGYLQGFYNTSTSFSQSYFLMHSYLGYDTRKLQYTVDFKINAATGVIQSYIYFGVAYKFGKQQ